MSVLAPSRAAADYVSATFAPPPPADMPVITLEPYVVEAGEALFAPLRTGANGPADLAGDTHFRYDGMLDFPAHAAVPASYLETGYLPNGSAQNARYQQRITTVTSPTPRIKHRFRMTSASFGVRVKVNGRWVSLPLTRFSGLTVGAGYQLVLTFPVALARTIEIETGGGTPWGGAVVALGVTLTRPVAPAAPKKVAALGDSYFGGASSPPNGAARLETYPNYIARFLGATSFINFGVGGTGWVNAGGGGTQPFADRIASILTYAPDVLIACASINDGASGTGVQAAVTSALAQLASIPTIIVIGIARAAYAGNNAAVKAATLAAGRQFVDPLADGWGLTDAIDLGTDAAHPTFPAHQKLGSRAYESHRAQGETPLPYVPAPTVSDDFNRADATTLGSTPVGAKAWTGAGSGSAGIESNRAYVYSADSVTSHYRFCTTAATGTWEVTCAALGTAPKFVFNYADGNNHQRVFANAGVWSLQTRTTAGGAVVASLEVTATAGDRIKVRRATDGRITVWINGTQVYDAASTDNTTGTSAGFVGTDANLTTRWDDFTYTPLAP